MDERLPNLQCCGRCGYEMSCATPIENGAKPQAGSISICLNCGHVHIFDERLDLHHPTPDEAAAIASDVETSRQIMAIRRHIVLRGALHRQI